MMRAKPAPEPPAPMLPAHRAFVVHFQTTNGWRRRFAGRAEHLSSGSSVRFGSLRELVRFLARFLEEPQEPPQ